MIERHGKTKELGPRGGSETTYRALPSHTTVCMDQIVTVKSISHQFKAPIQQYKGDKAFQSEAGMRRRRNGCNPIQRLGFPLADQAHKGMYQASMIFSILIFPTLSHLYKIAVALLSDK